MLKRDRRGVQALSGLLSSGGSSGPGHESGNEVGVGGYGVNILLFIFNFPFRYF